ncbi:MAG: PD40 domain-containing protein [Gemmatimonadota bacterium]|nr:MAG: PD40 domain-containing protein [Gemmatimonadota bacterium]
MALTWPSPETETLTRGASVTELNVLGSPDLRGPDGERLESVLDQPKGLALLTYLVVATPRKPQRRDLLIGLFWPESDEASARNSLNQSLHRLRRALGSETVVSHGANDIGVDPDRLSCDVLVFDAALAAGDHAKAVAAWGGTFLSGFYLRGCPDFERWVEAERSRLQRAYAGALERVALGADAGGDAAEAVRLWRQLAELDPYATRVTLRLMTALEVAGNRAGALHVAEQHAERLKEELDAEPSPEVEALAQRLRVQPAPSVPAPGGSTRERLAAAVAARYRVTGVAGAGAMALVYRAEDLKLGREVALKVLRPELAAAVGHERFLNEVEIAAGLAHPNILPLHDVGEAEGLVYYVMPYVEGESLRARLAREGPLEVGEATRIAREVAEALEHAHGKGIVHRDIKPANILLLAEHAVVSDFGVARAIGETVDDPTFSAATGTPAYMSPEQASGSPDVDGRSDLYSLGCVLHEMLTGAPPGYDSDPRAVLVPTPNPLVSPTSPEREAVPAAVEAALARAIARDPADRYTTARQFAEALRVEPESLAPRSRARHIGAVVAGVLVIALAAVAVWRVWLGAGSPKFTVSNFRHLTRAPEIELQPAISPDGREVVYSANVGSEWHLYVRTIGDEGPVFPLTADRFGIQQAPRWTPDGHHIVFLEGAQRTELTSHIVPRTGGSARMIIDGEVWDIRDDRAVYTRGDTLLVRDLAGGEETLVAWAPPAHHSVAWSPDGSKLAFVEGNEEWFDVQEAGNVSASSIWVVSVNGGTPVRVTDNVHMHVSPAWMPDGRHLLFVSDRDGARDIYAVQVDDSGRPRGPAERVSTGLDPHSISVSADGSTVAYSVFTVRQNIWEIALPDTGSVSISDAMPVTVGNQVIENHAVSRDGRWLAFDSNREGNQDIYLMPAEGGQPRRLTRDPASDYHPDFSPDGAEIVFYSTRHGSRDVFITSLNEKDPVRLTDSPEQDRHPAFSPDGLRIAFTRIHRTRSDLYVMSRDRVGGEWSAPELLTRGPGRGFYYSRWSPDGNYIATYDNPGLRLWIVSLQGEERLLVDGPAVGLTSIFWPEWSADGRQIYAWGSDSTYTRILYAIPVEGGELREVIRVDDGTKKVLWPISLRDGKAYITVTEVESDVWVLDLEW